MGLQPTLLSRGSHSAMRRLCHQTQHGTRDCWLPLFRGEGTEHKEGAGVALPSTYGPPRPSTSRRTPDATV